MPILVRVIVNGDCPLCGHGWDGHPVAVLSVSACVECIYEEDHGLRTEMCAAVPPELAEKPASMFLSAAAARTSFGRWKVHIVEGAGKRHIWAVQQLGWSGPRKAQERTDEVNQALRRMTVLEFDEWFKRR